MIKNLTDIRGNNVQQKRRCKQRKGTHIACPIVTQTIAKTVQNHSTSTGKYACTLHKIISTADNQECLNKAEQP